jgi:hypothetical protein
MLVWWSGIKRHRSVNMDVVLMIGAIASIYFAGLLARRRGRSFRTWAGIAAIVGPFAFVVLLFPDRRGKNGERA